ncbi:MAG: hypothetical protein AVDCRST_MAG35-1580, partial [uncultured Quadrisphaera sp.]
WCGTGCPTGARPTCWASSRSSAAPGWRCGARTASGWRWRWPTSSPPGR